MASANMEIAGIPLAGARSYEGAVSEGIFAASVTDRVKSRLTQPVIAREAKPTAAIQLKLLDCFVATLLAMTIQEQSKEFSHSLVSQWCGCSITQTPPPRLDLRAGERSSPLFA